MHIDIDSIYFAHAKQSKGQRLRDNVVSCILQLQLTCLVNSKFPTDRPDWLVKWFGVWCLVWCVRRWRYSEDACQKVSWGFGLAAFTTKLLSIPAIHLLSYALMQNPLNIPSQTKASAFFLLSYSLTHIPFRLFIYKYINIYIFFNLRVKRHHVYLAMNQSFLPSEYATSNCSSNFYSWDLNSKRGQALAQWKFWFFVIKKGMSLSSENNIFAKQE